MGNISLGKAVLVLTAETGSWAKDLGNAEKHTKKLQDAVSSVGKGLTSFGKQTTQVGKSMSIGLTAPILGIAAAALKLGTDFNASMANVATLIPGNTARVLELKSSVQELAIETGKSTTDLAEGLYQVVSAFGDTAESAVILGINARAAAAGLASTTDAIDLTSAVTKGYGDTSAEAVQKVSDLALQTVKLGQTTFPELAQSIGRVTPLTAALSVSQQELFGVMATATGVTGGAAEVSTQLRGVLQSLLAPTTAMTGLFEQLGVTSGQALIEQQGLQGALTAITQAAEASGLPLQKFIGSIEGQTLALALSGSQAATFTEKLAAMSDVVGVTDEAFKEQTEGVNAAGFAWNQFKQEAIVVAQQLGDELLPVVMDIAKNLKPLLEHVKNAVKWFSKLSPTTQKTALGMVAVLAAIGPVLTVGGTLITVVGGLFSAFSAVVPIVTTVAGVIAALGAGPLLLIVGAIAGVVIAWRNWDKITGFVSGVYTAVKMWLVDKFQAIVDSIKAKIDAVTGFFGNMYDKVVGNSFVPDMLNGIRDQFARLPSVMVDPSQRGTAAVKLDFQSMGSGILDRVRGTLSQLPGLFTDGFSGVLGSLKSIGKSLLNGIIKEILDPIWAMVASWAGKIAAKIAGAFATQSIGASAFGAGTAGAGSGTGMIGAGAGSGAGITAAGVAAGLGAAAVVGMGALFVSDLIRGNTGQVPPGVDATGMTVERGIVEQFGERGLTTHYGQPRAMAAGGFGRVTKPTLFMGGEGGAEDFAFSGANKTFGRGGGADAGGSPALLAEIQGLRRDFLHVMPTMMENAARHGAQTSGRRR